MFECNIGPACEARMKKTVTSNEFGRAIAD
jgi:hypothetical protein